MKVLKAHAKWLLLIPSLLGAASSALLLIQSQCLLKIQPKNQTNPSVSAPMPKLQWLRGTSIWLEFRRARFKSLLDLTFIFSLQSRLSSQNMSGLYLYCPLLSKWVHSKNYFTKIKHLIHLAQPKCSVCMKTSVALRPPGQHWRMDLACCTVFTEC